MKSKTVWMPLVVLLAIALGSLLIFLGTDTDDQESKDSSDTSTTPGDPSQDARPAQEYAGKGEYFSSVIHFTETGVRLATGENVSHVVYPNDTGRVCGPTALEDESLVRRSDNEVVLEAEHVGQTICFTAEFDTLRSPYQSIRITGFETGDAIKAVPEHVLGSRTPDYEMELAIQRPDLFKPATYVRAWHYRLSSGRTVCDGTTDFSDAPRVAGNRGEWAGYSAIDALPYGHWVCIRAEDLLGSYLYKQMHVTAPKLEAVIDGNSLFVLHNPEKPYKIGHATVSGAAACNNASDFNRAQRLDANALNHGGPRMLIKPLTKDDNGQWVCLWGENSYGQPDLFTAIEISGITVSADRQPPTATVKQLEGSEDSLSKSFVEITASELVSYVATKDYLKDEPDCTGDNINYQFSGNPSVLHKQRHVVGLGRYSYIAYSGHWVCYKLYDTSGNVGYVKFRYNLPPLASNDGIEQADRTITVRGLGIVLYLKFDDEPQCHNALAWESALIAQPNQEGNEHSLEIQSRDHGRWLCLRRYYSPNPCGPDEACPAVVYEPDITFHKYLIRNP